MLQAWSQTLGLFIGLVLVLSPIASLAADPVGADELAERELRFSVGLMAGGGGSMWLSPSNTELVSLANGQTFSLPVFSELRGGYTASFGGYVQLIVFEHLGFQIGAHWVQHTLLEDIDWNFTETITTDFETTLRTQTAVSEQELSFSAFHLPILVKAVIPNGSTRFSIGIGPEFAFGLSSSADFEITEATENGEPQTGELRLPGPRAALTQLTAKTLDSVYLNLVFGMEVFVGDFRIPIDLGFSYNMSQGSTYRSRAELDREPAPGTLLSTSNHPTSIRLNGRDTLVGQLRVGIAYEFQ